MVSVKISLPYLFLPSPQGTPEKGVDSQDNDHNEEEEDYDDSHIQFLAAEHLEAFRFALK